MFIMKCAELSSRQIKKVSFGVEIGGNHKSPCDAVAVCFGEVSANKPVWPVFDSRCFWIHVYPRFCFHVRFKEASLAPEPVAIKFHMILRRFEASLGASFQQPIKATYIDRKMFPRGENKPRRFGSLSPSTEMYQLSRLAFAHQQQRQIVQKHKTHRVALDSRDLKSFEACQVSFLCQYTPTNLSYSPSIPSISSAVDCGIKSEMTRTRLPKADKNCWNQSREKEKLMVGVEFQLHAEIKEHSMLAPVETSTPMLPFRGFLIPRH